MKRQRGRNRNNNRNNNNNHNRSMDSNGPDVKVRGTASTIYEKYTAMARDAASSGNRVKAENYRQHAEHYLRLMNIQEAAKQEAREKAEAERAARGETSDEEEGGDNRRGRGRNSNRRRQNQEQAVEGQVENTADNDEKEETPDGLETVTPKAEKRKRKSSEGDDAVEQQVSSEDDSDKPKRRRKAPSRKKDPETEIAE